jgi:hypothetical protein
MYSNFVVCILSVVMSPADRKAMCMTAVLVYQPRLKSMRKATHRSPIFFSHAPQSRVIICALQ